MTDRDPGFVQHTVVRVGFGASAALEADLARLGSRQPAVVIDEALLDTRVGAIIQTRVPGGRLVPRSPGEPTYDTVAQCAAAVADVAPDGLVAVGGGSTLDTAKVVRGMLAARVNRVVDLPETFGDGLVPLLALPTTAGTGAEVGAGAVVADTAGGDKQLVKRLELAADVALADAELTLDLPPRLTAFTGCDAFAQALLAFVAAGPESVSGQLALRAMKLIHEHLPSAVEHGQDRPARSGMMLGSVAGAMAMYNAPPTYAGEHAFAEPIGAALGVPHGHLVAAFLAPVAELNQRHLAREYSLVARELGLVNRTAMPSAAAAALVEALRGLVERIGIAPLSEVVEEYPVDDLIARCRESGALQHNPAPTPDDTLRAVFDAAYSGAYALS